MVRPPAAQRVPRPLLVGATMVLAAALTTAALRVGFPLSVGAIVEPSAIERTRAIPTKANQARNQYRVPPPLRELTSSLANRWLGGQFPSR